MVTIRKILLAIFLLSGAVFIISFSVGIFGNKEDNTVSREESISVSYEEETKEQEEEYNINLESQVENVITVLFIGKDIDEEGTSRSDSLIAASLNTASNEMTMVSLLRDTYVDIPEHNSQKLNAAYSIGGAELVKETLKQNFDVDFDYYVVIDYDAFEIIIDALEGIDIEISAEEAEYLTGYGGNYHNGKVGYYTGGRIYDTEEGVVHMYGQMALDYCRMRHAGNSDFERTLRQRKVIETIFQKCKNTSITTLVSLVTSVFPFIETDMTIAQISDTINSLFKMDFSSINSYRVPADGMYEEETIDQYGSVLKIEDMDSAKNLLYSYLYSADGGRSAYQSMTEEYGNQDTE